MKRTTKKRNAAEKIKELRERLGMTQTQLAEKLGVDQTTVYKYESGKQKPKTVANVKLAELAGQSVGEWMGVGGGDPPRDVRARTIKVVGELCAGEWREAIEWSHDEQYDVPALIDADLPNLPLQGYIVRGESMNRIYPNNAVVFAAATIANGMQPRSGDHVIVTRRCKRGLYEASLKEFVIDESGKKWLWPRSYDPQHQAPLEMGEAEEVTITGIVQASFITRPRRA